MPTVRRIVFGEPKVGFPQFAGVLAKLDESISYCNHPGTLRHDRVTDVPFSLPDIGLPFTQPTPLITDKIQVPGVGFGFFSEHHMGLYLAGAKAVLTDPVHLQCAEMCMAIYSAPMPDYWDERQETAGVVWGARWDRMSPGRLYFVYRGSDNLPDWLRDITPIDPGNVVYDPQLGPVWGGFTIGMRETWDVQKALVGAALEVVFTGHSLGAAHADIAAAYFLTDKSIGTTG